MPSRPPDNINEISPLDVLVGSRLSVNSTVSSNRGSSCILDAFPFSPDMPASPAHTTDFSSNCSSPAHSPSRSPRSLHRSPQRSPRSPARPRRPSSLEGTPAPILESSGLNVRDVQSHTATPYKPSSPGSDNAHSPRSRGGPYDRNPAWLAGPTLVHTPNYTGSPSSAAHANFPVPSLTAAAGTMSPGFHVRRWSSSSNSTMQSTARGSAPDIYYASSATTHQEDDGFDWGLEKSKNRELRPKSSRKRLVDKLEEEDADHARPPIRRGHTFSQSWDATALLSDQRPVHYVSPEFARQGRSRPTSPTIYPPAAAEPSTSTTMPPPALNSAPPPPNLASPDELKSPVPSFDFEGNSPRRPQYELHAVVDPDIRSPPRGHQHNSQSWDSRTPRYHAVPVQGNIPGPTHYSDSGEMPMPVVAHLPPAEHLRAGITAYVNGSIPIAFQHWVRAALAGQPVSRLLVEIALHEGWAKPTPDTAAPDVACIYALSASDLQSAIPAEMAAPVADGLVNMGLSRNHGAADERFALRAFELAAALGSRDASTAAASMYMKGGKHLQRNEARARQFFHQFP